MRNTIEEEKRDAKMQENEISFYFTAFPGSSLELALYPLEHSEILLIVRYSKDHLTKFLTFKVKIRKNQGGK